MEKVIGASLTIHKLLKFTLNQGWNLIGPFSFDVPVNSITTTPPGILGQNEFFGFNGSYYSASTLIRGYGYWIKSNSTGIIFINNEVK
jgi:hypothetical protein